MENSTLKPKHAPSAFPIDAPTDYPSGKSQEDLFQWPLAVEQLKQARSYWLATTRPDGRPHLAPLWGAWVDEAFYFQGAPNARWSHNLAENPNATVHLESGSNVVIVVGIVDHVVTDAALAARLIDAWRTKYGQMEPRPATDGLSRLLPRTAQAWGEDLQHAARWTFAN